MMQVVKIISLGLLIWGLGLVWPELNLGLILAGVFGVGMLLAVVAGLLYLGQTHHPSHLSRPSRPVAVH
jgi:hypothetical protein